MRDDTELKKRLTPEQYRVACQGATEQPFANAFWNNKKPGIYVDVINGKPLFSSTDKFDSATGWPSFIRPIEQEAVAQNQDRSAGMVRTEVRSSSSDAHLGHVFDDGPAPAGLRYCINSAALKFIPVEDMEKAGYGQYLYLFGKEPAQNSAVAYFAAGCFWGVESAFRGVKGVSAVTAGYMGGSTADPSYEQVCSGGTGHAESVKVDYDPALVSYEQLLEVFFTIHDPTTLNRQGPDAGSQYRSAVFFVTPEQEKATRQFVKTLSESKQYRRPIVTQILPAKEFYKAEGYHQRYFEKQGIHPTCHIPAALKAAPE